MVKKILNFYNFQYQSFWYNLYVKKTCCQKEERKKAEITSKKKDPDWLRRQGK